MAPAASDQRLVPYRVIVANDSTIEAVTALSDLGNYVAVDVASMNSIADVADSSDTDDDRGVRLYQSIYETALRDKVPPAIIEDMVRIYSYDIDFQRKAPMFFRARMVDGVISVPVPGSPEPRTGRSPARSTMAVLGSPAKRARASGSRSALWRTRGLAM